MNARYVAEGADVLDTATGLHAGFLTTEDAEAGAAWMNSYGTPTDYRWTAPVL